MGNFYTNYTLRGPSQQTVAAVLAGRSAIITPAREGCVVVFDERSDDQDSTTEASASAFHDPHWHTRYLAAEALSRFGSQAAGHARELGRLAVEDPDDRVRRAAAYGTERLKGCHTLPANHSMRRNLRAGCHAPPATCFRKNN